MSKQESLLTVKSSSACDVEVAFSGLSRKTGREVSSIFAQAWYIVSMAQGREGVTVR